MEPRPLPYRPLQVRLRTLLIGMTLISVLLAILVRLTAEQWIILAAHEVSVLIGVASMVGPLTCAHCQRASQGGNLLYYYRRSEPRRLLMRLIAPSAMWCGFVLLAIASDPWIAQFSCLFSTYFGALWSVYWLPASWRGELRSNGVNVGPAFMP